MIGFVGKYRDSAVQRLVRLEPFPQPELIRLRHPVVLMHGFGMLAAFRRGGQLHDEAMNLRLRGVLAYAPNVAAYSTVPVRTEAWARCIERVLAETGAEQVHLVAHSMGGLDARYLVSRLGLHRHVATLTTVSTPHHGSAVACLSQRQPERVRRWLAGFCNWMGEASLEACTADFVRCVHELTPEFVQQEFNPSVPDHPDVRYFSYAGIAGRGTHAGMNPWLRVQNAVLYREEGVNDGMVSERSARWGEFLGTFEADHAQQVGLNLYPGRAFRSNAFWVGVVRRLAEGEAVVPGSECQVPGCESARMEVSSARNKQHGTRNSQHP